MSLLLSSIACSASFNVGIVGAHGGLGRELVQQCFDREFVPIAIVRRDDDIPLPQRHGGLVRDDRENAEVFSSLQRFHTKALPPSLEKLDAVAFVMSGRPFEPDTSTQVVVETCSKIRTDIPVCLVSAYGTGDTIKKSNVGIKVMRNWYLRSVYDEKMKQETLVSTFDNHLVIRPRALSFSPSSFGYTRAELANDILDYFEKDRHERL